MKNNYLIPALAALMAVSCIAEQMPIQAPSEPEFYASIEVPDTPETKVYADDGLHVHWNAGDRISLFNQNTLPLEYVFNGQDGSKAGSFSFIPSVKPAIAKTKVKHIYKLFDKIFGKYKK